MAVEPFPGGSRALDRWAGGLSLAAAMVHGAVTPDHFDEWWGYGLFFIFAAAAQALFGLLLLTDAVNPKDTGATWWVWKRRLYWAGILGTFAIMVLYVVTRTVGIPLLGPEAGEVEDVGVVDVVSKALEAALVVVLAVLVAGTRRPARLK